MESLSTSTVVNLVTIHRKNFSFKSSCLFAIDSLLKNGMMMWWSRFSIHWRDDTDDVHFPPNNALFFCFLVIIVDDRGTGERAGERWNSREERKKISTFEYLVTAPPTCLGNSVKQLVRKYLFFRHNDQHTRICMEYGWTFKIFKKKTFVVTSLLLSVYKKREAGELTRCVSLSEPTWNLEQPYSVCTWLYLSQRSGLL